MFIDELELVLAAGDGGDGVVRWRHEKYKPKAGPAGGNGGRGGDVYLRAVPDINRLSKYVGSPEFSARAGSEGRGDSQHGANAEDLYVEIPVGSIVTDIERERTYTFLQPGQVERVLRGGRGGLGNEYFKSSTNRAPVESTSGKSGEQGRFMVEVALMVHAGLIGLPNAGKSSLLNTLTNADVRVGDYPFTTLQPHLGDLQGFTLADIPGLISGAAEGKGLGHTFLRHVTRTEMLLHLVSVASEDPLKDYYAIREELSTYGRGLEDKKEWIILSKIDLVDKDYLDTLKKEFDKISNRVFVLSILDDELVRKLRGTLINHLAELGEAESVEKKIDE